MSLASFTINRSPQQFNNLKFVKYNRATAEIAGKQARAFTRLLMLFAFCHECQQFQSSSTSPLHGAPEYEGRHA
jgi:hypothetical protein